MAYVLIVDDSKTVREYHKHILKDQEIDVDEADNGMEAYEKSLSNDYDLFLVDINMPVMDGYTFITKLRTIDNHRLKPVIMISTEAQRKDREKAYDFGANCYFIKPVKPKQLVFATHLLTK